MSKFPKWIYDLRAVATPTSRKCPTIDQNYNSWIKKAPLGTAHLGNEPYIDSGNVMHRLVGDKLVERPYCSNGVEVIITPLLGEVSDESIADHYEGHSG